MRPQPASHLRIARPSRDLQAAERFWVGGLGLSVLYRVDSSAVGDHGLLMAGWPGAAWHLELVGDPIATPTEEDLLVLYLDGEADEDLVRRLVQAAPGSRAQSVLGRVGSHDRGPGRVPARAEQPLLAR